jgi:CBS domain-containing protein
MKADNILESKGRNVFSIHVDAIIADALQVMNENNIGALMVLDDQGNIHGIISERDVMRTCHRSQGNCRGLSVKDIMTPRAKLIVARGEDEINDLMGAMTQNHIRHIPIVDDKDRVKGMISIGDIIKAMLQEKDFHIRHLTDYIESKYPL